MFLTKQYVNRHCITKQWPEHEPKACSDRANLVPPATAHPGCGGRQPNNNRDRNIT